MRNAYRSRALENPEIISFFRGLNLQQLFPCGERILEIGCGRGLVLRDLVKKYGVIAHGVDLLGQDKSYPLNDVSLHTGLAEDLPFDENTFGTAFSYYVFHYVPDKLKALSEAHRVLKRGGKAIIDFDDLVPNETRAILVNKLMSPDLADICARYDTDHQIDFRNTMIHGSAERRSQRVIITKKSDSLTFPSLVHSSTLQGKWPFAYSHY